MKKYTKNKPYKKLAVVISFFALIVWIALGTGASLAWFSDSSPEINNIFHFGDFELEVSHRLTDGTWEKVDSKTKIFNQNALYEPGYVQVVYLKVENKGDVDFQFNTAVALTGYTTANNVYSEEFNLQDYLKFGLVTADNEEDMKNNIPDRQKAKEIATMKLSNYETENAVLQAGETSYIALIVRMPEEVGNVANYRGEKIPEVNLGIIVKAEQIKD